MAEEHEKSGKDIENEFKVILDEYKENVENHHGDQNSASSNRQIDSQSMYTQDLRFINLTYSFFQDSSEKQFLSNLKTSIENGFLIPLNQDVMNHFLAATFLKFKFSAQSISFLTNWRAQIKIQYKSLK